MIKKIKVLMVDDEKQFRATTKKILNKKGFETVLAESGEEAINKLEEKPDVVILDIKMPGMAGHQALKEIKKISPDLPVIMLTGHGALPSAEEALTKGAFDYLTKPCDIDLLAAKITDACHLSETDEPLEEKQVMDVMISIENYSTLTQESTVKEAIEKVEESFFAKISTSRIMETGHRSLFVLDNNGNLKGIITIRDLLKSIMPAYLSAPKPSTADSIQYSPMFWKGMFYKEVKQLAKMKAVEIMSPAPLTIEADANLMEAAYMMVENKVRRLAVMKSGKLAGTVREQELFFEIAKIL